MVNGGTVVNTSTRHSGILGEQARGKVDNVGSGQLRAGDACSSFHELWSQEAPGGV